MIPERLSALRGQMKKKNIAVYIIPTADFHMSEYVGEYFKAREYMTGFTGSAGTAVITMTEAGLWTDGRYFLQAEEQLAGTGITLYRMGEEGVPTVDEYIEDTLKEGECLGFDGRVLDGKWGKKLRALVQKKHGSLQTEEDLVGLIWMDRPKMSGEPVWILDTAYSGQSTADKLAEVRQKMQEKETSLHLLTSLCDIAYLLNLRGNDICYVPVALSYLVLTKQEGILFLQEEAADENVRTCLLDNGITIKPYDSFYGYLEDIQDQTILLDTSVANDRICSVLAEKNRIVDEPSPVSRMKAVKNETELANIRKAHVKDAVAMCRFMYRLKKNVGKVPMTELSVSEYLTGLRADMDGFLEPSFETISGYAEHGAIVHYAATAETDVPLKPEGFLLVDSGGHYLEGTTDITRTFALGELTREMKELYTRVCRANLNLMDAKFLYGCTGKNLDILAREPLWEAGLEYRHGTGHGVGYILNVHEGTNAFRWHGEAGAVLEEGMVTTDEPGVYLEGKFGIRLENELLCRKGEKNEYGQFMYFENLTYVPFDLDAILPEQMTETEKRRLDAYHEKVYETVAPYLEGEELAWLRAATEKVSEEGAENE